MMMQNSIFPVLNVLGPMAGLITTLMGVGIVLLHIFIAVGISQDAGRLQSVGRPVRILLPIVWAGAGLFFGLIGVALYWLVHYSTFTRQSELG